MLFSLLWTGEERFTTRKELQDYTSILKSAG